MRVHDEVFELFHDRLVVRHILQDFLGFCVIALKKFHPAPEKVDVSRVPIFFAQRRRVYVSFGDTPLVDQGIAMAEVILQVGGNCLRAREEQDCDGEYYR